MLRSLCFLILTTVANHVCAPEFWIAPLENQINSTDKLQANFHVGQDFVGPSYTFVPRRQVQTKIATNAAITEYQGTLGDRPAIQFDPANTGLFIIAHETTDDVLTYRDWQKFVNFVEHKDFTGALERHADRGLPETGFRETYRRHAKSLVAVGDGAGSDQKIGLDIEIVALKNPYTSGANAIPVQVWLNGTPRSDTQVEVFTKTPDGTVSITTTRTNADGIATIPVQPGHTYMIDNVALVERDGSAPTKAVWHSMWANLTFHVPE